VDTIIRLFVLFRREKVKRKRAQAAKESVSKPQDAIKQNQQQPDPTELAKGLPNNWQVCFLILSNAISKTISFSILVYEMLLQYPLSSLLEGET